MFWLALASIASTVLVTLGSFSVLRFERRAAARERDLLVNQVCNLAGRPWMPSPSREVPPPPPDEDLERLVALPERYPD